MSGRNGEVVKMDIDSGYLAENLLEIRERVAAAAKKSGRNPEDITIVAVSKTFSEDLLLEAHSLGIRDFGESYVQEAVKKIDDLKIDANWHFIGHMQKNKAKPVVQRFKMIQSVDSDSLLARIDRIASEEKRITDVLLQINVAGEQIKSGMDPEDAKPLIEGAGKYENVRIRGLMLIPPFYEDPEENRENFAALRKLSENLSRSGFPWWEASFLSMGMSDDYEIAIEEGSNMVRIGRALFGPRRRN